MREENLISKVKKLTEDYSFSRPFSDYLKEYFRGHPEMGARDRRETKEWCFNLLRIGRNLQDLPFEKRLCIACFLGSDNVYPSLSYLLMKNSEFSEHELVFSLDRKIEIVKEKYPAFSIGDIFPLNDKISPEIEKDEWFISFLRKPKTWIRIKEKYRQEVLDELEKNKISFSSGPIPNALSFNQGASLEKLKSFQRGYFEIQDINSQRTAEFFHSHPGERWWDACAGAGGKSLLLKEENPDINLLATDSRRSILNNYSDRMKKSGCSLFNTEVLDLSTSLFKLIQNDFDGIITDVPCSGSGTWSRSPEWLRKDFSDEFLDHFIALQRKIVSNVLPGLKTGFPLIYITCSVFEEENERNISYFLKNLPVRLEKSAYLKGYYTGSDTLYMARLIKLS